MSDLKHFFCVKVGRVLHKDMKGGLSDGDADVGLTAYVLIALLDAGVSPKVQNPALL